MGHNVSGLTPDNLPTGLPTFSLTFPAHSIADPIAKRNAYGGINVNND
jgi:hypothetical protein